MGFHRERIDHVDLLTPADLPLKFRAKVLEEARPV
jgi:hypothetical protein